MTQMQRPENPQQIPRKKSQRAKRKGRRQKLLFLFFFLIFLLGFLLGLFVGMETSQDIHFTVAPAEDHPDEFTELESSLPWNLTLVNAKNPLSKDFAPETLAEVDNGYSADSRIEDATKRMISDARQDGVRIIAVSAFRDYEYQAGLYEKKVQKLQNQKGYSIEQARKEAATVVAYPGTSEHQLGLALDLVDARHVKLDKSQENTAAYKWLKEHCDEYGFIVRYPNDKTDITGIIYEPWHFRYVGEEAAKFIMDEGICLEEYLEQYYQN